KNDQSASLLEGSARLRAGRHVGLQGSLGAAKVDRDRVAAHLGNVATAIEHQLEVAAHAAHQPPCQHAVDDPERMVGHYHQRTLARDTLDAAVYFRLEAEHADGIAP